MAHYRCKSPDGLVHVAFDKSWRDNLDWNEREVSDQVDEAVCDYANYMERVKEDITCLACFAIVLMDPEYSLEEIE